MKAEGAQMMDGSRLLSVVIKYRISIFQGPYFKPGQDHAIPNLDSASEHLEND